MLTKETTIIIDKLKEKFGETKITANLIDTIIKECMELVEKLRYSGPEKKQHVITIVRTLVVDLVKDPDEEKFLLQMIDNKIIENMIDLIVLASKGELNINKKNVGSCIKTTALIIVDTIIFLINKCSNKTSQATSTSATSTSATSTLTSTNIQEMNKLTETKNTIIKT
jgi:hypothetical protein